MTPGRLGYLGGWLALTVGGPLALYPDWAGFADDRFYGLARQAGLVGLAICLLQPAGMGWPSTRLLGSGKLPLHKITGILGMALMLAHPALLAISAGDLSPFSPAAPIGVWLGRAALLLLVVATGAFLLVKSKKIKFPQFSRIHTIAFPAGLLALVHGYLAGYSMRSTPSLLWYFVGLALAGIVYFVLGRIRKSRGASKPSKSISAA